MPFPVALRYLLAMCLPVLVEGQNSTFYNPILPGFHPDPSCIFVPEWNETFFCASSSFNAFPGIPIHASKDLQNWKLIGNVLNREEQLPRLAYTNSSTSGIWAPGIRYHNGTFWVTTTLVDDDRPRNDSSRWDNVIFKSDDPFDSSSWTNAVSFNFTGYDPSPFWDDDGTSYIVASHAWHIYPAIEIAQANLETGEVGDWKVLWNGTGGIAPEGPRIIRKDGWYYLLIAEGGTGLNHMATMARSRNLEGPYESNPANPVLTAANTTNYFQTVGHADLFQDPSGNWWGSALSTRSGPEFVYYPMGRETVLTSVRWDEGEFPVWKNVSGQESGWAMPPTNKDIEGSGPFINEGDDIDFAPGTTLPAHFTYWRYPNPNSYTISPEDYPNTLRLSPSRLNLTALNGNYAGPELGGQTFVGRRQQDTLFTYSIDLDYSPAVLGEEAGVTIFLTQNHHLDIGVVMLPANESTMTFPGTDLTQSNVSAALKPQIRFRGISTAAVPDPIVVPLPSEWLSNALNFEVKAANSTHYSFSVGPANDQSQMQTLLYASNVAVSWGYTGVIVGIYCTSNGGNGTAPAYFSNWEYIPEGQYRDSVPEKVEGF
ncbi:Non-reducing end alpha-L-arabinofuranosidase [Cytospora mali]|uniref:Non-reducing end alpha-L-arabinofuranosidase n=1 Tax=Cytospora mali TaxID=578113 RepID=A0A194VZR5_CYTMA|nr:Non-reducing end alpha-L-arabinofuranosidase [Valsa mali]